MPDSIPSLWPDIKVDAQTPLTILKVQAEKLRSVTKGILEGTVESETTHGQAQHRLVINAPAFNSYRHTLLTVTHKLDLPYPAEVRADCFTDYSNDQEYPEAHSDDELQKLVHDALQSKETKSIVLSLIAKSNEARIVSTPA